MLRAMLCTAAVCFMSVAAAAIDDVDLAIKVVKETGADASRLRTYCELTKTISAAGNKQDAGVDAKIDGYLKQLGPNFETAWNTGESADENSVAGREFSAALDELASKCSSTAMTGSLPR
jgi:hypothetical protein